MRLGTLQTTLHGLKHPGLGVCSGLLLAANLNQRMSLGEELWLLFANKENIKSTGKAGRSLLFFGGGAAGLTWDVGSVSHLINGVTGSSHSSSGAVSSFHGVSIFSPQDPFFQQLLGLSSRMDAGDSGGETGLLPWVLGCCSGLWGLLLMPCWSWHRPGPGTLWPLSHAGGCSLGLEPRAAINRAGSVKSGAVQMGHPQSV